MRGVRLSLALLGVAWLGGCSFIPHYRTPAAPVAADWPKGEAYAGRTRDGTVSGVQGWRDFFLDPALQRLLQIALENNRDLRTAALNLEAYRAQYRIQRSELFPTLDVQATGDRQRIPDSLSTTGKSRISSQYSVTLGTTSWELDFFGRLRSLNEQTLEQYFASEEARRSTQISLVASVANAYLAWQADQALLQLTRDTLQTYEESYRLTERSFNVGVASALDLSQARTAVEDARAKLAQFTRQVAQDRNALTLLLGASLPADLQGSHGLADDLLARVPAGLPSRLLQRRPDVLQAEHQLKAANASIGAARAAFFPNISLTADAGTLSKELSGLFTGGSGTWLYQPQINLPIFTAGRLRASLNYAEIQKDIGVAQYEKAIQVAFQEVSDGLAAHHTYRQQLSAQRDLVKANELYYELAERRYRTGVDSYLTLLDAQRQLFSARQKLISDRLDQLISEVDLFKALGGGWAENNEDAVPPS